MRRLLHRQLYCSEGRVIGTVCDVIADDGDVLPRWLVIDIGVLEPRRVVPGSVVVDAHGRLTAPYPAAQVTSCPVDADHGPLGARDVASLHAHYGLVPDTPAPPVA